MNPSDNLQQISQVIKTSTLPSDDLSFQIDGLLSSLEKMGIPKQAFQEKIESKIFEDAMFRLNEEMVSKFTNEDMENLTKAFNTGLNDAQKSMLVQELYTQKTGKPIEEFALGLREQILEQVVNELAQMIYILTNASKLSDTQCDEVMALLKEEKYTEAFTKFGELSGSEVNVKSSQDEISQINDYLKKQDYNSAIAVIQRLSAGK